MGAPMLGFDVPAPVWRSALADVLAAFQAWPRILYLAWGDTVARYRRSLLGPLWMTLGAAAGGLGLGTMWSYLFHVDRENFIATITVGLLVWQFIAAILVESPTLFVSQATLMRNLRIPVFYHVLALMARQLITFLHNSVVIVFVLWAWSSHSTHLLLSLLGALLVLGNLLWMSLLLALLGARLRDVGPLVQNLMPLLFFLTPIMFKPQALATHQWMVWWNPLSYMVCILRDPLLGEVPAAFEYEVTVLALVLGWALSFSLFAWRRARLIYWV